MTRRVIGSATAFQVVVACFAQSVYAELGTRDFVYVATTQALTVIDAESSRRVITLPRRVGYDRVAVGAGGHTAYATAPNGAESFQVATAFRSAAALLGHHEQGGVLPTADGRFVLVTNTTLFDRDFIIPGRSIAVIDVASFGVSEVIPVDEQPVDIVAAPSGQTLYVTHRRLGTLTILDALTLEVIDSIVLGPGAERLAVTPDGTMAYVVHSHSADAISIVDLVERRLIGTLPLRSGRRPSIAVSSDGRQVWIATFASRNVQVLDASANTLNGEIPIQDFPTAIAFSQNGNRAYVGTFSSLAVVDTETWELEDTIAVPGIVSSVAVGPSVRLACPGDCDRNDEVTVDELLQTVSIALGTPRAECPAADGGFDGSVTVDDVQKAVFRALEGCSDPGARHSS